MGTCIDSLQEKDYDKTLKTKDNSKKTKEIVTRNEITKKKSQ
jgi:hypothetical protein